MSRARDLSRLSNQTNFTPDVATGRVGLGSENPTAKLNVAGIVSATAFYGDGSNLEGVSGSGIGTALADEGVNSLVYYADKILGIVENTTIDVPDTSDSNVAYTKYAEVSVSDGIDLIIADGDDFIPDILGISSDVQVPGVLAGNGGRVRADNFSNKAGTGAPNFPSGLTGTTGSFTGNVSVGGVLTYEDVTNIDSIGIITARSDVSIADKIIHTGDTNTAIRFPAADTFSVETAGTARLQIDSTGNTKASGTVWGGTIDGGVTATTSFASRLYNNSAFPTLYAKNSGNGGLWQGVNSSGTQTSKINSDGSAEFAGDVSIADKIIHTGDSNTAIRFPATDTFTVETAGSEALRIDSSGEVGIGTVLPGNALHVFKNGDGQTPVFFETSNTTGKLRFYNDSNGWSLDSEGDLRFVSGRTGSGAPTRLAIDSTGMVSTFSNTVNGALNVRTSQNASTSANLILGQHSATSITTGTLSFIVFSNGNTQNTNNSYGAISDIKMKENIVDAGSQWDDFKAVRFRKYNFKEETGHETFTQLGVIAQELELVSPGLVTNSPDLDEDGNDLDTTTKGIKYSILTTKALVALQEAMDRIETLESEVKALKAG